MIKKLRIKLVVAAMLSLLVVLAVIIGTAGALNYKKVVTDADEKLQMLQQNDGNFPEQPPGVFPRFSPEMPFEIRFFSVSLAKDQTVQSVNTGKIAAVDSEQAAEYATKVMKRSRQHGFVDTYRYLISTGTDGASQIYFLSCYRELESFRSFLWSSIVISLLGSLAVLLLLAVLSQRIVKPVSESYEKQKRFITDAGHELKTPLTIISADTEVLEMDYGENEWLADIRTQTARLADLTNNLVFLARMEEQPQIERVDFCLSDAAAEAVEDFSSVAKSNGLILTSFLEPNLHICGDEKNLRRLISIFLENAIKYTSDNGAIRVSLDRHKGQLRLQVFNTTEQIDREALPHLFDRFYRTDESRNSKTGGYGLGLSIAAAIVASHNGKVSASTEDEKSLLITVLLPAS